MADVAWRRSGATLWRRTSSGVVLLPPGSPDPVQLGGAAALVWDLLEEPTSVAEATDLLARACGEDPSHVRPNVEDVVDELCRLGAVERETAAAC